VWGSQAYQAKSLENWADKLQGIPFEVDTADAERFMRCEPRLEFLTRADRDDIAAYLRARAAELEANQPKRQRGRPARTSDHYKLALDVFATRKRLVGKERIKTASIDVMQAWSVSATTLADAWRNNKDDARREFQRIEREHPELSEAALSQAISQQLRATGKNTE
jgi:hypothetical protein